MGVVHRNAPPCSTANRPFSFGLCLPQHTSLPCNGSFVVAGGYGCAIGFVGNACGGCGMGVVHRPAPSCALTDLPFSLWLCLPPRVPLPCHAPSAQVVSWL